MRDTAGRGGVPSKSSPRPRRRCRRREAESAAAALARSRTVDRASPRLPPQAFAGWHRREGAGPGARLQPPPRPPALRPETIVEEPEPRGTAPAARGAHGAL